jgi:hypothetical protein
MTVLWNAFLLITFYSLSAGAQMMPMNNQMMMNQCQPMPGPGGQITFPNMACVQQYTQMNGAAMGQSHNCIGMLAQNFGQSLSQSYQARAERNNLLMQQATTRFEHLKECRRELLEAFNEYQKARTEHQQKINQMQMKMSRAELEYKTQVLQLEKECRQSANEEFNQYREQVYQRSVIHDPTQLPGFNQRINSHRRNFFENCYRDQTNVKMIGLSQDSYRLAILEIETEIQNSRDALANMEDQISRIQTNTLRNCEDQDALNDYNEALARQNAADAIALAQKQAALGAFQAIMGCVDPGRTPSGGGNPDATRGQSTRGTL